MRLETHLRGSTVPNTGQQNENVRFLIGRTHREQNWGIQVRIFAFGLFVSISKQELEGFEQSPAKAAGRLHRQS